MDLHRAAREGDREVVNELLRAANVDVNAKDDEYKTALHLAVEEGHVDIVRDLLRATNVDVNAEDEDNKSALFLVVKEGHVDVNAKDKDGKTALHLATHRRREDLVRAVLEAPNVDVNAEDKNGKTALFQAVTDGNVDIVKLLLDVTKEDINKEGEDGMTIIVWAARFGHVDLVKELLGRENVNVNSKDGEGMTALYWAAWKGHVRVVDALLGDERVDANLPTYRRCSALHLAVLAANADVTRILANNSNVIFTQEDGYEKSAIEVAHYLANAYDTERKEVLMKRLDEQNISNLNIQEAYLMLVQRKSIAMMNEGYTAKYFKVVASLIESNAGKVFMDNLYRDRQVYVDAANAILVGAALIASVTFASWLQPPLSHIDSSYVPSYAPSSQPKYADVEHNAGLGVFWIFNSLSFYFAIGTVVLGASSVIPRRRLFIKIDVDKLRRNLWWTSFLLALSVFCILVAFGTAGVIVIVPIFKPRLYMIVPMIIGGMVSVTCLGYLLYSILEESWLKDHRFYFLKKFPSF